MRKEDKIHELIEEQNPEAKQRIIQKVMAQLPSVQQEPAPKRTPKLGRWQWASIALAVVCVITLAIVLPLTLGGPRDDGTDDPNGGIRFCDVTQYKTAVLNQTLKEYAGANKLNILYLDWYDVAEEVSTSYSHAINDSNDVIYLKETIINGETGDVLELCVTDSNIRVDKFEAYYKSTDEFVVNGISVQWRAYMHIETLAMFEYEKHIYYLDLNVSDGQDQLKEIIEDMLTVQQ